MSEGSARSPRVRRKLRQEDLEHYRQHNLGQSLMEVARHFQRQALAGFVNEGHTGLQASHQAVLTHLSLNGTRLSELARRAAMSRQAIGQLVDELEGLGYVERIPDPDDRRARKVRFTEKGSQLMLSGTRVGTSIHQRYTGILGAKKMERLRELLAELYDRIREEE
jgi:DNA-binding MarR family transcriptional regulator